MGLLFKVVFAGFGLILVLGLLYWLGMFGFLLFIFRDQSGFEVKDGKVFYRARDGESRIEVAGADAASFKTIRGGQGQYGKDKNDVYGSDGKVVGADRESFTPLDVDKYGSWARDKDHLFFSGRLVEGADPSRFKVINPDFMSDHAHVFSRQEDPATRTLSFRLIHNADPASFTPIENSWSAGYGKDKNAVYLGTATIAGANPRTFRVVAGGYAADDKNVYYNEDIVPGADALSLQETDVSMDVVKDKHRWYSNGQVGTVTNDEFVPNPK